MEENVLYVARTHPKVLFRALLVQAALLALHIFLLNVWPASLGWDTADKWGAPITHAFILGLEIWYVFIPTLQWWNSSFILTNKRVKNDWGVLYKQSREIDLARIASISEERGVLDRMFGCGTLNFYDAAAGSQPHTSGPWNRNRSEGGVRFHDVPKVKEVRAMVEKAKYSAQA